MNNVKDSKHKDPSTEMTVPSDEAQDEAIPVLIAGGGLVGLVMALALHRQCQAYASSMEIYEQAAPFDEYGDEVGAAITLLPNGLRVLRDILEPHVFQAIRDCGARFDRRSWQRHDGTEVAVADDSNLHQCATASDDSTDENSGDLHCLGIRRSNLQAILYQAVQDAGIPIFFRKNTINVRYLQDDLVEVSFADDTSRIAQLVLGCDGNDSQVRYAFCGDQHDLEYTEITVLMGIAKQPKEQEGDNDTTTPTMEIPSSPTTQVHGMYYPCGPPAGRTEDGSNCDYSCFQLYSTVSTDVSDKDTWGNLSQTVAQQDCHAWAKRLQRDGWHDRFVRPLQHVTHAVRVGFCTLDPPLEQWAFGSRKHTSSPRVVLVGDSAHPTVPFLGQGTQLGIEDAGTLALLLKQFCCPNENENGDDRPEPRFYGPRFDQAIDAYQALRIPRAATMLAASLEMGARQTRRCESARQQTIQEEALQQELQQSSRPNNLPSMILGTAHDYRHEVQVYLKQLELQELVAQLDHDQSATAQRHLTCTQRKRRHSSPKRRTQRPSLTSIMSRSSWTQNAVSVGRNLGRMFHRNEHEPPATVVSVEISSS